MTVKWNSCHLWHYKIFCPLTEYTEDDYFWITNGNFWSAQQFLDSWDSRQNLLKPNNHSQVKLLQIPDRPTTFMNAT